MKSARSMLFERVMASTRAVREQYIWELTLAADTDDFIDGGESLPNFAETIVSEGDHSLILSVGANGVVSRIVAEDFPASLHRRGGVREWQSVRRTPCSGSDGSRLPGRIPSIRVPFFPWRRASTREARRWF